jgi:hypothetical protein
MNLDEATALVEKIRAERASLLGQVSRLTTEIDAAKSDAAATGKYCDREWFLAANEDLRTKKRQLQTSQDRLGDASRALKAERHRATEHTKERLFIATAKEMLSSQQYENIWREVELRLLSTCE